MNSNLELKISNLYDVAKGVKFVRNIEEGYLSQNYVLETPEKKFFLKQYSDRYELDMVRDIHKVKFFFAKSGIPIILPYKDNSNEIED